MNKKIIQSFIDEVVKFRQERDWQQFIELKDIAVAISIESSELLEHFQWKTEKQIREYIKTHKEEIEEEMMDVLFNVLHLAEQLHTDIDTMFLKKMEKNKKKYPIAKVKGKNPHL